MPHGREVRRGEEEAGDNKATGCSARAFQLGVDAGNAEKRKPSW